MIYLGIDCANNIDEQSQSLSKANFHSDNLINSNLKKISDKPTLTASNLSQLMSDKKTAKADNNSKLAENLREKTNHLSSKARFQLLEEGMEIIYGGSREKSTAKRRSLKLCALKATKFQSNFL